ncbi:MAG: DNA polymerase III subunit delta' [Cellvibrionales bacterium]
MSGLVQPLDWHVADWQQMISAHRHNRLPHAILLSGPKYIGKQQFSRALAQHLLCITEDYSGNCGHCKGCQLNAAGTHPDLTVLAPEEAGKAIGISDIRMLAMNVSKTGQQGGWKIIIITPAEAMTASAANALLKTLEEPQGQTLIMLVSHELGRLPATIRSRCQRHVLPLPSNAEALSWLQSSSTDRETLQLALTKAQGRPLMAQQYLTGGLLDRHRQFDLWIDDVAAGRLPPLEAALHCQKLDAVVLIDWFLFYLHHRICSDIERQCYPQIFSFYDKLGKARGWIMSGANPNSQLVWEELFFDWLALSKV